MVRYRGVSIILDAGSPVVRISVGSGAASALLQRLIEAFIVSFNEIEASTDTSGTFHPIVIGSSLQVTSFQIGHWVLLQQGQTGRFSFICRRETVSTA